MAVTAQGLAKAAEILAGQFMLVATNVPYLGRGKQDQVLQNYCEGFYPDANADLEVLARVFDVQPKLKNSLSPHLQHGGWVALRVEDLKALPNRILLRPEALDGAVGKINRRLGGTD